MARRVLRRQGRGAPVRGHAARLRLFGRGADHQKAEHGGLQILVYPMKKERYEPIRRAARGGARAQRRRGTTREGARLQHVDGHRQRLRAFLRARRCQASSAAMALAAGGRIRQQIYKDPYGTRRLGPLRLQPMLRDAGGRRAMAGDHRELPPTSRRRRPTTARRVCPGSTITLPIWNPFPAGAPALALVKGVAELAAEKGEQVLGADGDVDPNPVIGLTHRMTPAPRSRPVRESQV